MKSARLAGIFPLKNTFFIAVLSLLLCACTTNAPRSPTNANNSSGDAAARQEPLRETQTVSHTSGSSTSEPAIEDPLPRLELTPELLFKLLSAEIAYQRDDWQTAYVTMLTVAEQTRDPRIARRAAEVALSAKRADEALAAVQLWRALAPNSEEATQYYLSLAILSDNLEGARAVLEERLKEARPQTRGLMAFQLQRLLDRAKDKAAAFLLLEQVLTPYLDMPEARLALAQAAFANGNEQRARQEAQLALKTKPDSELAVLALAQATPDASEAAQLLSDFVNRYPDSREVRLALARMLVEQKQYEKARTEFEVLLNDQPQDLTSLYALGVLSVHTEDLDAAEKYLTTYLDLLSTSPDEERDPTQALLLLAQIAEERKDTEAALKWLARIEPGEAYLNAQIKRAQVMAKRGDLEAGRRVLQESTATGEREQSLLVIAEGQLLREAGQLQEAMAVFEDGLDRFPTNTDLLYDYAMVADAAGQWDVMENALRRIMEIAPDNQHAYNALGYSLAERGSRLQEARALIEKALKLAPNDAFIIDSMGWVQFRLGNLNEAEAALRRAYSLRPDAEIATHLGEVLWVQGKKEDAQKFWREAQTRDPQNDTLKATLVRLNVDL